MAGCAVRSEIPLIPLAACTLRWSVCLPALAEKPITDVCVVYGKQEAPEGFEKLEFSGQCRGVRGGAWRLERTGAGRVAVAWVERL